MAEDWKHQKTLKGQIVSWMEGRSMDIYSQADIHKENGRESQHSFCLGEASAFAELSRYLDHILPDDMKEKSETKTILPSEEDKNG